MPSSGGSGCGLMSWREEMLEAIRDASATMTEQTERLEIHKDHRNTLIAQALEGGISQRDIAAAAGLAKSRITAIYGNQPSSHVV